MNIYFPLRNQFFAKFYLMIPISIVSLACIGSFAIYFISFKETHHLIFLNHLFV